MTVVKETIWCGENYCIDKTSWCESGLCHRISFKKVEKTAAV